MALISSLQLAEEWGGLEEIMGDSFARASGSERCAPKMAELDDEQESTGRRRR